MEIIKKTDKVVIPSGYLSFIEDQLISTDILIGKIKQVQGGVIPPLDELLDGDLVSSEHYNQFVSGAAFNLTTLFSGYNRLQAKFDRYKGTFTHYISIFDKVMTRINSRLSELKLQATSDFTTTVAEEFDDETRGTLSSDGFKSTLVLKESDKRTYKVDVSLEGSENLLVERIKAATTISIFEMHDPTVTVTPDPSIVAVHPGIFFLRSNGDGTYVTGSDRSFQTNRVCVADVQGMCAKDLGQFYFNNCVNNRCPGYEPKNVYDIGIDLVYKIRNDCGEYIGVFIDPGFITDNVVYRIECLTGPVIANFKVKLQTRSLVNRIAGSLNTPFPIEFVSINYDSAEKGADGFPPPVRAAIKPDDVRAGFFKFDFIPVMAKEFTIKTKLNSYSVVREFLTREEDCLACELDIDKKYLIEERIPPFESFLRDELNFVTKLEDVEVALVEYAQEGEGSLRSVRVKTPKFLKVDLTLNKNNLVPEVYIKIQKKDFADGLLIDTYEFFYPYYQTDVPPLQGRELLNPTPNRGKFIVERDLRFPVVEHFRTYLAFESRYVDGFVTGQDDYFIHEYKTPEEFNLIPNKVDFAQGLAQFAIFSNGQRIDESEISVSIGLRSNKISGWQTPEIDNVVFSIGETDE